MKQKLIIVLFLWSLNMFSQDCTEEYSIINFLFDKRETHIFKYFIDLKGYEKYVDSTTSFDELYGNCIVNSETLPLKKIFNDDERKQIVALMKSNYSEKLKKRCLKRKISRTSNMYRKDIVFIAKPIIVNNKAILLIKRENEEIFLVLKKSEEKWYVVCQKYVYLTLED